MNRWYTNDEYLDLINRIRSKIPQAEISTDIIVGFPGETQTQFKNTVSLANEINFAYAYVSKYSARPNTAATKGLEENVPYVEKERRFKILDELINHKGKPRSAVH